MSSDQDRIKHAKVGCGCMLAVLLAGTSLTGLFLLGPAFFVLPGIVAVAAFFVWRGMDWQSVAGGAPKASEDKAPRPAKAAPHTPPPPPRAAQAPVTPEPRQPRRAEDLSAAERQELEALRRRYARDAAAAARPHRLEKGDPIASGREALVFEYADEHGEVTVRRVTNWVEYELHIEGRCQLRRAKRTFRKERITVWIEGVENLESP
jgi:hypothetical protein